MSISPFLSIHRPCDKALRWTKRRLSRAGLRAVQTFDLHTARVGLHDCPCPNHGTEDCDCQMVILLVYRQNADVSTALNTGPATLILHGNNGQTWLSMADDPRQQADVKLNHSIRQALEIEAPVSNSQAG